MSTGKTLEVNAFLLGDRFGRIVVKYQAVDTENNKQILSVVNSGRKADQKDKKYFTHEEASDIFRGQGVSMVTVGVSTPDFKMPVVGARIPLGMTIQTPTSIKFI